MLKWVCGMALSAVTIYAQETRRSISGLVVDAAGAVIPNALISAANSSKVETRSDSSGEFVLSGLEPGLYHLKFEARGFIAKELDVSVEAGKEKTLGRVAIDLGPVIGYCLGQAHKAQSSRRKLTPGAKSRVLGEARGGHGNGLKDLTATLDTKGASKPVAISHTNENGEFQFFDITPGVYDLSISLEDEPLIRIRTLRVPSGYEVKVRLKWAQPQICL